MILGHDKYGRPLRAGDTVKILSLPNVRQESRGLVRDVLGPMPAAFAAGAQLLSLDDSSWVQLDDRKNIQCSLVARIDNDQFTPADTTFHELLGQISKQGAKA